MTPSERSGAARPGLTRFQIIRYSIYTLLMLNLFYYLWEDLIAFRYVPRGASLAEVVENFAVTIDYVAWMVLIVLFELETDFIPSEKFKGWFKWTFNGVLAACYVVLLYAFYGYVAALVDFYHFTAFPPEKVCGLVDGDFAYVTMDARFVELTLENCSALFQDAAFKSADDNLVAAPANLAASIWLGWVDVANAGVWLLVVLFIEWELMLELKGALSKPRIIVFKTIKGILYLILLGCAIYWTVESAFIDYWDAYLWLIAFVLIDLNVIDWDDKPKEAIQVQGGHSPLLPIRGSRPPARGPDGPPRDS
jgi:hypothetical protein